VHSSGSGLTWCGAEFAWLQAHSTRRAPRVSSNTTMSRLASSGKVVASNDDGVASGMASHA
jgi:hypothetical protein